MASLDDNARQKAEQIIGREVDTVKHNPAVIKDSGCAACHVLFNLKDSMSISEQDAADLVSEVLLDNSELNEQFIQMVEDVQMKSRMMGTTFLIKTREAKDRYIYSNFKNTLSELLSDASVYGTDLAMRKLILSTIALNIAQNLGIDYHAATEELYYYMRKNDMTTHEELIQSIRSLLNKRSVEKP